MAELILGVQAYDRFSDLAVNGLHRLAYALPAPAALVSIPNLDCLVRTRGRARWNGRPAHRPVFERDVHFDGRIATTVQDLAGMNIRPSRSWLSFLRSRNNIGVRDP